MELIRCVKCSEVWKYSISVLNGTVNAINAIKIITFIHSQDPFDLPPIHLKSSPTYTYKKEQPSLFIVPPWVFQEERIKIYVAKYSRKWH